MWAAPLHSLSSAVLWADATTDIPRLLADLGDSWRCGHVTVDEAMTKSSLIAAIGDALGFPDWAGTNLDALYDLLTDLDWLGDTTRIAVVIERTPEAIAHGVDGWQQIVSVIQDAAAWWQPEARTFVAVLV